MPTKPEQPADSGAGPHTERRYYIDIADSKLNAPELLDYIKNHVAELSPDFLAQFEKVKGEPDVLEEGHEFHIKILGPWNGAVCVKEVGNRHFEFCTLEGHPEAGRIRFSVDDLPGPATGLRFEIHSWARSRDGLVAFAYSSLGIGKRVQEEAWVTFCQNVLTASGGQALGPVQVATVEDDDAADDHREEHHAR